MGENNSDLNKTYKIGDNPLDHRSENFRAPPSLQKWSETHQDLLLSREVNYAYGTSSAAGMMGDLTTQPIKDESLNHSAVDAFSSHGVGCNKNKN